jgi:hypothetical protein
VGSEHRIQRRRIGQTPLHEHPAEDGIAVTGGKIVQHDRLVPALEQQLDHVRPDVARPADDQDFQAEPPQPPMAQS